MRKTLRAAFVALIVLVAFAAVTEYAQALPAGTYVLRCRGGRWELMNIIGNVVWSGPCDPSISDCSDRWLYKIVIYGYPVNPSTSPSGSPAFEGHDAAYWIRFINTLQADSSGTHYDIQIPQNGPTLSCGTGDITLGDSGVH